jgi:hypothetical protein
MTNRLLWIAALVVATVTLAPRPARACDYDAYGNCIRKDPWKKLRFEGSIGALVGSQRIGWIAGTGGGMHVDGGIRRDRMMLYAEYDVLSVGESSYENADPVRGLMQRVGLSARYSLAAFGGGSGDVPVRGDIWAEVGAGHEHIRWYEGGVLQRRDISFGLGAQATFRIGREKPRFVGIYYAMKAWVAPSPGQKNNDPNCAGPCDYPTGPMPYDFGIFFNFGVPFGK